MEFRVIQKTPVFTALSNLGKQIFQPDGIFYWSGRAKKEAEFNATIGTATGLETDIVEGGRNKNLTYYLPLINKYITMEPEKLVEYAPPCGLPELRKSWAEWIIHKGKTTTNFPSGPIDITGKMTTPVVCSGVTDSIFITSKLFLDRGETIIMPNKAWENYECMFSLLEGLKIEMFDFFKGTGFNFEALNDTMLKVAERQSKIVIILNFPNNPTGYSPTIKEVEEIRDFCITFCEKVKKPLVIMCDDAYEGYVYTNEHVHSSIFYELTDRHPLLIPIKMDGSSKEMLMYGGRVAAVTLGVSSCWFKKEDFEQFDKEWDNKLQAMIRTTISNSNHYAQEILSDMLKNGFDSIVQVRQKIYKILQSRYFTTLASFKKLNNPRMHLDPAGGGFFVFINVEGIDAKKLADHLLTKYKVGTIPSVNLAQKINGLRFAFCSVTENHIEECFIRIDKAVKDLI